MDVLSIIGNVVNVISLIDIGIKGIENYKNGREQLQIDDIVSKDSELQREMDKLLSELKAQEYHCIRDEEKRKIKEQYFSKHYVAKQYDNDINQAFDVILDRLNDYLVKKLSVGEQLIYGGIQEHTEILGSITRKIEEIQETLQDEKVSASTKDFIEKYNENLFWDKDIRLSDVYIEPVTIEGKRILEVVDSFLKDNEKMLLFIEAVAGSGKSSFMSRLANEYGDSSHYFIKLSELDVGASLCEALSKFGNMDSAWSGYYRKGNVLFLDGFDEIAGRIDYSKLEEDIRKFRQKHIKVIITTRPNYTNRLSEEYVKIYMDAFHEQQIIQWIYQYAELKKLKEEEYKPYVDIVKDKEKFQIVGDVIRIPIFLYIILNKQIDVRHMESETQLFKSVFDRLLDDKVNREQYEVHMDIAKRIGYFLQSKSETTFREEDVEDFLAFSNCTLGQNINKEALSTAFESSFIKSISEGKYEKEFYHKSIQDYFAAAFIFDQLGSVVNSWEEGNIEEAVVEYTALFDTYEIKEEWVHLEFMIMQDKTLVREKWIQCFQEIFQDILDHGIATESINWCINGESDNRRRFTVEQYVKRNQVLALHHMKLMIPIFQAKLCDKVNYRNLFYMSTSHYDFDGLIENKAQFIWDFCYGQTVFGKELSAITSIDEGFRNNVLAFMMSGHFAVARKIHLFKGEFELELGKRATGKFIDCTLESIQINRTKFHEVFLEQAQLREFSLIACHVEFAQLSECIIEDSTFFTSIHCSALSDSAVIRSQMGNKRYSNPMRVTVCTYHKVSFEYVTFLSIQFDDDTIFEDVTFTNCTFSSCVGKAFKMINCKMDQFTYESFEQYHPELCKQVTIHIIEKQENNIE